jgi:4-amino-4-deoxy-L-arabinose transferase-like glycosyltransferase
MHACFKVNTSEALSWHPQNQCNVYSHFLSQDITLLCTSAVLLGLAVLLFLHKHVAAGVVVLTLTAFLLRLTFCLTDPFLYDWDEQFHALVARNMADNPFKPMLYPEPLMPYTVGEWDRNHIWLHKQPLFLWLIALSVKIGGFTPLAVKMPSLLLSACMVPAVYRIGKLIYTQATGFYAAMLVAVGFVFVDVVTGITNTDHNDVIFSAFVLFSVWAFTEYAAGQKRRMRVWVAVFAACAVLTKWLPGLLVFGGWGLWLLLNVQQRRSRQAWIDFGSSLLLAAVLVLPWQIYIHIAFPEESAYELRYSALHFTIPIEAHGGPWNYHLLQLQHNFGIAFSIVCAAGWLLLLVVAKLRTLALSLFAMLLVVFVFYTLAATKMPLFTLPAYALFIFGAAVFIDLLLRRLTEHRTRSYLVALPLILLAGWGVSRLSLLEERHTSLAYPHFIRQQRLHDRVQSYKLKEELGEGKWAVFGLQSAPAFYFYTGITAYKLKPDTLHMKQMQQQGWKVAVYDRLGKDTLPEGVYRIRRRFLEE